MLYLSLHPSLLELINGFTVSQTTFLPFTASHLTGKVLINASFNTSSARHITESPSLSAPANCSQVKSQSFSTTISVINL